MKKMILLLSILCLVGLASTVFAANALTNPGFEGGSGAGSHLIAPPWNPGFTQQEWGTSGTTVHSGDQSFYATTTANAPMSTVGNPVHGYTYNYVRQMVVFVDDALTYDLGAWINKSDAIQIALRYEAYDVGGTLLDEGIGDWHTTATDGWEQITYGGIGFAEGTDHITYSVLLLATSPTAEGTAYVDDCSVEAVPEPSSLLALFGGLVGAGRMIFRKKR